MRRLRLVRRCPDPSVVRGEHCDGCNTRVHDLTRSVDAAADVARLGKGASICARIVVAATLSACSAADVNSVDFVVPPPVTSAAPDAGPDAIVPPDNQPWMGEMSVE